MRPSNRKLKKWRKSSPMKSRSYAEKRERSIQHIKRELEQVVGIRHND